MGSELAERLGLKGKRTKWAKALGVDDDADHGHGHPY